MASDPRTFLVKNCAAVQQKGISDTQKRKDFFNGLGKVGDLEILNNSALGGKVGQGLRTLADTSNSIRTGNLDPNNSVVPQNGTDVLAATGISQGATNQAARFNPGAVNRAVGQADVIAEKVKSGDYNVEDIPGTFTDIQNLSSLIDGTFNSPDEDKRDLELCGASPWARDLIAFAPKYKFLFIMEFELTEPFAEKMNEKMAAFVVKSSTRPQVNFEHEEVNMYNFWVRVPKRTSYEPMTIRMYDDNQNAAMTLYTSYLKAVSPIANLSFPQKMEDQPGAFEAQSMGFGGLDSDFVSTNNGEFSINQYASSLGPVTTDGNVKNVFKRITMYHVYNYGNAMNTYRFFNPKVLSMELDEMDMADNGNGNEVTMQFAYDAVNITLGVPVDDQTLKTRLKQLTSYGQYPFDPNFGGETAVTDPDKPPGDPDKGGGFFDGIANAGETVTDAISGGINAATGLVSDAFTSVSNFAGSIFTTAAGTGDDNASKGSVEPDI